MQTKIINGTGRLRKKTISSPESALLECRKTIDQIDDYILALLQERSGVVHRVSEIKHEIHGDSKILYVRPQRELQMIQKIKDRTKDNPDQHYNKDFFPYFIRSLISAGNFLEQDITIAVIDNKTDGVYSSIFQYYGFFAKIVAFKTIGTCIKYFEENRDKTILAFDAYDVKMYNSLPKDVIIYAQSPIMQQSLETHKRIFFAGVVSPELCKGLNTIIVFKEKKESDWQIYLEDIMKIAAEFEIEMEFIAGGENKDHFFRVFCINKCIKPNGILTKSLNLRIDSKYGENKKSMSVLGYVQRFLDT